MAFARSTALDRLSAPKKSKTRRHLTEFWMVEPEMAYATLEDVKRVAEELIVFIVGRVLENRREELKRLERDVAKLEAIQAPFPRMSYDDASRFCNRRAARSSGAAISAAPTRRCSPKTASAPSWWTASRLVQSVLFPAGRRAAGARPGRGRARARRLREIIGGGQRIHDPELLLQRIQEHNLPREAFQWYIDLRKYGTVPHGGFGMGIERCVAWICGLEHIRETIASRACSTGCIRRTDDRLSSSVSPRSRGD